MPEHHTHRHGTSGFKKVDDALDSIVINGRIQAAFIKSVVNVKRILKDDSIAPKEKLDKINLIVDTILK